MIMKRSLVRLMLMALCAAGALPAVSADWEYYEAAPIECKMGATATMPLPDGCGEFTLEGKLLFGGNHIGGGLNGQQWELDFIGEDGNPVRRITGRYDTAPLYNGFADSRFLKLTLDSITPTGESVALDMSELHDDIEVYGRVNTLVIDNRGGTFAMWLGRDGGVYAIGGDSPRSLAAIRIGGSKNMRLDGTMVKWRPDPRRALATAWTTAQLDSVAQSAAADSSRPTGRWRFLDRDTDSRWAEPGGRYRLMVVPHDPAKVEVGSATDGRAPAWDVIYVGGGETNRSRWEPGMVKAHMYATPYEGHYDVVWYDAFFEDMGEEVTADFADGAILTFRFPLYKAQLRFARD